MTGKLMSGIIVICALVAGVSMYYLQVYGFYDEVTPRGEGDVQLTSLITGAPEAIEYSNFEGIDAESSPIRYRACFKTSQSLGMLTETYALADLAEPRVAPDWFECFDAAQIGADLEAGTAVAFLGQKNIEYGIDRVVAIYPDGSGYVWHEINDCGEKQYDGSAVSDDCPKGDN